MRGLKGSAMPEDVVPSLLALDHEHHQAFYITGQRVGWTGTRAEYAWYMMVAPVVAQDYVVYLEARRCTDYEPFPYRGVAFAALRRHAEMYRLRLVDHSDARQQFEEQYSEALEQEIQALQAHCRRVRVARKSEQAIARLQEYEALITQLSDILTEHFTSEHADRLRVQSLLQCFKSLTSGTE